MRKRRYFKILLLAVLGVSLLQIASWLPGTGHIPVASAHSFVIGSDPIDGSTITKVPALVRIYFDAPIAAASRASVVVFAPGASPTGQVVNAGKSVVNANNPDELDTPLLAADKLPQGSYEVRWTALSLTDGHTTSGLIGFNLGISNIGLAGTPTLGPSTSNYFPQLDLQGALSVAWDWLVLLTLLFWVGILLTDYLVLPRTVPEAFLVQARKHSRSLQLLCLVALLVGEVINLILRATTFTQALGQSGINTDALTQFLLHTNYGLLWLARMVLLLVALGFQWASASRQHTSQPIPATPVPSKPQQPTQTSKASKRFSQLRQQARPEPEQEPQTPASTPVSTLALARSQARVSGAVAVHKPSARGPNAAQPKITVDFQQEAPSAPVHSRWQMVGWLLLAGLILLTEALSNELVQLVPLQISASIMLWLGLAAQAAWFGLLAYLGLILLPHLPAADPDHHAETTVALFKRAIPLLFLALGVLLVSEIFVSEATLQVSAQLLSDPYGRALLARIVLLILMLLCTIYIFVVLLPNLQRQAVLLPVVDSEMPARRTRQVALAKTERMVRRSLQALAALAATSLICVALMNFFAPPVVFPNVDYQALLNQENAASSTPTPTTQTQQAGGLTATFQLAPARTGVANTLTLTLSNAQNKPVSDATVKLSINMVVMDMGTTSTTINGGSSTYTTTFKAGQAFSMAGQWHVQVEIDRDGQTPVQMTFTVMIN
jgi:methionine-rich copper-binding protein CopC/putative copper export protein